MDGSNRVEANQARLDRDDAVTSRCVLMLSVVAMRRPCWWNRPCRSEHDDTNKHMGLMPLVCLSGKTDGGDVKRNLSKISTVSASQFAGTPNNNTAETAPFLPHTCWHVHQHIPRRILHTTIYFITICYLVPCVVPTWIMSSSLSFACCSLFRVGRCFCGTFICCITGNDSWSGVRWMSAAAAAAARIFTCLTRLPKCSSLFPC